MQDTRQEWRLEIELDYFDGCNFAGFFKRDDIEQKVANEINKCISDNELHIEGNMRNHHDLVVVEQGISLSPVRKIFVRFYANKKTEDQKYRECLDYFIDNLKMAG